MCIRDSGVHSYDEELKIMKSDDAKCVNCHRCVSLCPTRALKIVKTDHTFKENKNWPGERITEIYKPVSYTHLDVYKRQRIDCCFQI